MRKVMLPPLGECLILTMVDTIYDLSFDKIILNKNIRRLTNQLWKLIPMRENNENWKEQLSIVIIEIVGLNKIFNNKLNFLIVLSKLEGLREVDVEFKLYRKLIFDAINLINTI